VILTFKKCTLKDIDLLTRISWQTFYNAYKEQNDPENFKSFLDDTFNKKKLTNELKDKNCCFYFVYESTELVGYLKLNEKEAQTEIFDKTTLELERIYILDHFQGKGIGKQMLQKAITFAKSKSVAFIWLGVWEINTNAIEFYKSQGFTIFDSHIYRVGNEDQKDWLMKMDLS